MERENKTEEREEFKNKLNMMERGDAGEDLKQGSKPG